MVGKTDRPTLRRSFIAVEPPRQSLERYLIRAHHYKKQEGSYEGSSGYVKPSDRATVLAPGMDEELARGTLTGSRPPADRVRYLGGRSDVGSAVEALECGAGMEVWADESERSCMKGANIHLGRGGQSGEIGNLFDSLDFAEIPWTKLYFKKFAEIP